MSVQYTFLSKFKSIKGTKLQVCSDERRSISVLQYKAQGFLSYSRKTGMYSKNRDKQIGQIRQFLQVAESTGIDLVITPEASVPMEIIKGIIDGTEVRPEEGKLWCLGVEGISKQDYRVLIEEWGKKEDIVFVRPKKINMKKHINLLFFPNTR